MSLFSIIVPIAGLVLAFVGLLILTPKLLDEQKKKSVVKSAMAFPCPTCQGTVLITKQSIHPIKGAEAALVIQNVPDAPLHDLAEQRCRACSSMLTFRIDEWPPVFLIENAAEGQRTSNKCVECRKPLVRPNWPRGMYDEKIEDIPDLNPKLGLKCPRCDAVSCVACLENVTRNRTQDGSYLCPRCFRNPVNLVYHF